MKSKLVKKNKWFTEEEMTTYATLAQSSPGPIAINASVVVGYQVAGFWGAFAAALGCSLPPLTIMILVTVFYNAIVSNTIIAAFMRGVQYGVAAMLLDVLWGMFKSVAAKKNALYFALMAFALVFVRATDFSVFILFGICVVAALIKSAVQKKKGEDNA